MTDLKSPLPSKPEYWDNLARRVAADAAAPLEAWAAGGETWYGVVAARARWLVATSVAAMVLFWLILPPQPSQPGWIERSVAPADVAGRLLAGPSPPSVDRLLAEFAPAAEAEEEGRPRR